MAWMKAMPITPWATARIVATDSMVNSSPRSTPTMRAKIARLARSPALPKAMMMPAMMNAATKARMAPPMLATIASAALASSPIFGCRLLHQRRQVVVRQLPIGVDLRADHRQFGDARPGRRNLQRVLLYVFDQAMHRVANRIQQYRRGHDDQRDAEYG